MTRALLSATHRSNSRLERLHAFLAAALLATAAACAERSEGPPAQRLVDAFSPAMVAGSPPAGASAPPAAEWRFDGPAPEPPTADWPATRGWQPLRDVDGLAVRDGRLTATTASGASLLRLVRESGFDEPDLLHEVRVRLTASAGTEVSMHLIGAEEQEFDRAALADTTSPTATRTSSSAWPACSTPGAGPPPPTGCRATKKRPRTSPATSSSACGPWVTWSEVAPKGAV